MHAEALIAALDGGLIVSCQTHAGNPLHGLAHSTGVARAAQAGGAAAIRADGPAQVAAIRRAVTLPVIAIFTRFDGPGAVSITPAFADARALVEAGADAVALDATARPRPGGERFETIVARIRSELGVPVFADAGSVEDGRRAQAAGADVLGSSIDGYAEQTASETAPDLELVKRLVVEVGLPVIAQRRYSDPERVASAFAAGAHAVVVGSAISDPVSITRRFVARTPTGAGHRG